MKKEHRNFVRILALTVFLLMLAAVSSMAATKPAKPLKEVTLKFFFPGDDRPAKNEVLEALSKQTKSKLNAKFEFNFVPFGDYQNKLTMMAASGDNYDACFTADWFGYAMMVNKGAFLNLNNLAPKYAPKLYKYYKTHDMIAPCSVNGQLFALPWTELKTSKPVFAYRQDIAEKLKVQAGDLTTIEGIDKFLTAIAQKKPGMIVFDMAIGGAGLYGDILSLLQPKYEYQDLGFHTFYLDLNDPAHKVLPLEQTPIFKEAVKYAKKWYDSGIISRNALMEKQLQLFENGRAFSKKDTNSKLFEKVPFIDKTAVCKAIEVYPGKKFTRDSPLNNAMAINKNAANPERTLMFFELLSTDRRVYDTVMYGIKGKTYTVDSNGIIGFAKGENPAKPLWQNWSSWGLWRVNFYRPTLLRSLEAIKKEQAYASRPNIVISPLSGFVPNPDPIKTELAKRDQIAEEQGKLLLAGIVSGDIDEAIKDYIEKQKAAGLDKILVEVQKQVDSFIKSSKNKK